jgi:hypothetical protein
MKMSQGTAGAVDKTEGISLQVAPDVTPEISGLFEEWLRTVEEEILDIVNKEKSIDRATIAARLRITEKSLNFFLEMMKKEGKLKTAI